jgi:hypothetical protein
MSSSRKNIRTNVILGKSLWQVFFLTLILTWMSLGMVIPINATSSANMTLEIEWETFLGSPEDDDSVIDMIPTQDGGFTVLGENDEGWILVKFTATGQQVWNTSFQGTLFRGDQGLVQTADGGYVIADRDERVFENWEFVLHKRDSTGQHVWKSTFGNELGEWPKSIALTEDGGFVVVGSTNYNISLDSGVDMWLVKTNSLGVPEWNSTFSGTESETAFSVVQTIDGGYAVAGVTDPHGAGGDDVWFVKTDASGIEEWNQTFGGAEDDSPYSMLQIADGSFLIAGNTQSFASGSGNNDFWLLKTDVNGQAIWNTTYGTLRHEELLSIIQTTDGGFLLTGTVDNVASDSDIWLVKTDTNGQQEWNTTLGGSHEDSVASVVQVSNNSFVIAGSTQPSGTNNQDMWLVQVQVTEEKEDGVPGFEWLLSFSGLSVIVLFIRKRRR